MPLVRVCAAGVGSVRSWRTWRRAFTTGFTLDMLKNVRFSRGLGETRFSQCVMPELFHNQSCGHMQLDMLSPLLGRSRMDGQLVKVFSALLVRIVRDSTSHFVMAPAESISSMPVALGKQPW